MMKWFPSNTHLSIPHPSQPKRLFSWPVSPFAAKPQESNHLSHASLCALKLKPKKKIANEQRVKK